MRKIRSNSFSNTDDIILGRFSHPQNKTKRNQLEKYNQIFSEPEIKFLENPHVRLEKRDKETDLIYKYFGTKENLKLHSPTNQTKEEKKVYESFPPQTRSKHEEDTSSKLKISSPCKERIKVKTEESPSLSPKMLYRTGKSRQIKINFDASPTQSSKRELKGSYQLPKEDDSKEISLLINDSLDRLKILFQQSQFDNISLRNQDDESMISTPKTESINKLKVENECLNLKLEEAFDKIKVLQQLNKELEQINRNDVISNKDQAEKDTLILKNLRLELTEKNEVIDKLQLDLKKAKKRKKGNN